MKKKIIVLYCLIIMLAGVIRFPVQAQQGSVKPETKDFLTSHGPNSSVRTIKQDSKGNMWLVSLEGIIRCDGKRFTNITGKINSHRFWDVLEDRHGNFWIASIDSGVYYYDGTSFRNYTTKEGLASNAVFTIYEDKAGIIWFGTSEGASRYDGTSFQNLKTTELPSPAHSDSSRTPNNKSLFGPLVRVDKIEDYWLINETDNRVHTILEDKTGKLWFGTWGDVRIYDGKTYTSLADKYGQTMPNVQTIIEDKNGNIWFNGGSGLWRYDGNSFTKVLQRRAGSMIEDKKGNLWTTEAIDPQGEVWALSRYDVASLNDKKPTITEIKPGIRGLFGIAEARDGSIWFGTTDGAYRYDGKTAKKL